MKFNIFYFFYSLGHTFKLFIIFIIFMICYFNHRYVFFSGKYLQVPKCKYFNSGKNATGASLTCRKCSQDFA